MIYLDNAATTLHKPPEVAEAVKNAILTAGNASRGAHGVSLSASRMVFETRSRLRLLSRLLPFRYMLLHNQEKYQKEQSDKPTRQQIYRLRARLPLIFRKSFWLLGLQQQLLLFC